MTHSLMTTYRRLPVTFAHGEGALLWDTDGKRYLDANSGLWNMVAGFDHPGLGAAAAARQVAVVDIGPLAVDWQILGELGGIGLDLPLVVDVVAGLLRGVGFAARTFGVGIVTELFALGALLLQRAAVAVHRGDAR